MRRNLIFIAALVALLPATRADAQRLIEGPSDSGSQPVGSVFQMDFCTRPPPDGCAPGGNTAMVHLLGTSGSLSSPTVIIHNGDGPDAIASNAKGDFIYGPTSVEFRQVTAFYHAQKFLLDYLPTTGFKGLGHPLVIETNSPGFATGYNHSTRTVVISDKHCSAFVDQVVHEAMHAVMHSLGVAVGTSGQFGAAWEGIADYFTAVYKGHPVLHSCCDNFPPRSVDNDFTFADYGQFIACGGGGPSNAHANGLILAGALWELRQRIGPVLDDLVIYALGLPANSGSGRSEIDFAGFSDLLFEANDELVDGQFFHQIQEVFFRRGIPAPNRIEIFSNDIPLVADQLGVFEAAPRHGSILPTSITWKKRCIDCNLAPCPGWSWEDLGSGPTIATSDTENFELHASWTGHMGFVHAESLAVRVYGTPTMVVSIEGPSIVTQGTSATYRASVTGSEAPFEYQWRYGPCNPQPCGGGFRIELGTAVEQSLFASTPFVIEVEVTGADCRSAWGQKYVQVVSASINEARIGLTTPSAQGHSEVRLSGEIPGLLRLDLFDVAGRRVVNVWEGRLDGGGRTVVWNASGLSKGVYFYRLSSGGRTLDRKSLLVR